MFGVTRLASLTPTNHWPPYTPPRPFTHSPVCAPNHRTNHTHTLNTHNTGLIAWDTLDFGFGDIMDVPSLLKRLTEDPLSSSTSTSNPLESPPAVLGQTSAPLTPVTPPAAAAAASLPSTQEPGRVAESAAAASAIEGLGGDKGTLAVNDGPGASIPPAKHGAVWPFRARA